MYEVRCKGEKESVFKTEKLLQAEMVAIALALSSLYGSPQSYEVRRGFTVLRTITTETAFAAMQVKMRNLIFNKKITKRMPYMPDQFTNFAQSKIIEAVRKDKSLDILKQRLYTEVDAYVTHVRDSLNV